MTDLPPGVDPNSASFKHANTLVEQASSGGMAMQQAMETGVQLLMKNGPAVVPHPDPSWPPELSMRARGWLKFLHTKATTRDDWSMEGLGPHEWWDGKTSAPMSNYPRFDLHYSAYAVALMADRTPAWQEAYSQILDGFSSRYTTHWSAVDWLNQFGDDPDRKNYPIFWKGTIIPAQVFGQYNTPGWTGNGLGKFLDGRPAGIQADPIEAEGMLFYKGWLTLTMSLYGYVSGDDKFFRAFNVANVGGAVREWTLDLITAHLEKQWKERECGLH